MVGHAFHQWTQNPFRIKSSRFLLRLIKIGGSIPTNLPQCNPLVQTRVKSWGKNLKNQQLDHPNSKGMTISQNKMDFIIQESRYYQSENFAWHIIHSMIHMGDAIQSRSFKNWLFWRCAIVISTCYSNNALDKKIMVHK